MFVSIAQLRFSLACPRTVVPVSYTHLVYVPRFYDVSYQDDGTVAAVTPNCPEAAPVVKKRIIVDLDKVFYPRQMIVPFIDIVHDRIMLEVFRGCTHGCRFCQAGVCLLYTSRCV